MNYDVDSRGLHTVRITLQRGEYKGHFTRKLKGNCHGRKILDFDFECDDIDNISSDCKLKYDEEDNSFSVVLTNDKGVEWYLNGMYEDEMNDMIVGIEIIDFQSE